MSDFTPLVGEGVDSTPVAAHQTLRARSRQYFLCELLINQEWLAALYVTEADKTTDRVQMLTSPSSQRLIGLQMYVTQRGR